MSNENVIKDTGRADLLAIIDVVEAYINGLFTGDTALLERIFTDDAFLKAPDFRLSRDAWLRAVESRPVPRDEFPRVEFKIGSLELIQEQAMVKVVCPLFEHDYVDFLSLLKEDNQWRIVNKMYVDTGGRT